MDAVLETRLDQLVRRHAEIGEAMAASGVSGAEFTKLSKEYSELSPIVDTIAELRQAQSDMEAAAEMIAGDDPEMKAMAEEEAQGLRERLPGLEMQVRMSLVPKDED